ncbi:hypothetical protein R69658_00540 [Paraburkholderia aspalathi]|uniref:Transmembrane protein n=1 Tax=Paraburkholderia aspalathi TaxID=1324617 RepID=A0ABM8QKP4_9BURK|nr:hypothetical protein [Paraburkholderia aspalathi]MBK3817073.1 hypothetical protein [Paraburkholderia aspalathi]MBK3828925.1 hypothetical protein [Paraburkholderia aspalathi]MBK3858610.1 hypothetical protein [Paraburkholderia aspalathi]CAE6702621.1 hypothetical protein R69658_00540 [Paraburkholderia aspalathi]
MQIIDAHRPSQRPRKLCAALTNALTLTGGFASLASFVVLVVSAPLAHAEAPRFAFAVIASTMQSPADEAPTQRLIDAIGRDRDVSFVVYDGNLKGAKEACRDALYERRHALLETSRPALFFIPGQHDWADCGTAEAGGFDPVERLDQLRQTLFTDSTSMGQNPIALTRESEVSRFRPFRENVRWQVGNTVFVGLNAPSPNNHYLTAGGRNGEFEDRVIANAFWLEHAGEYAKRRDARAIVVFIQGDPDPERYERPDRFAWLRFARNTRRDGFLEFKRSLVKLAQIFRGPVLVIHCDDERASAGFVIDQPLRNDKGMLVTNLTRVALAPHDRLNQWIQIEADLGKKPPFRVSVRDVPKQMPMPTAAPAPQREEPAASMPAVPALGPASELPPLLQTPGQQQPDQQQYRSTDDGNGEYGPAMSGPPASTVLPHAPGAPSGAPGTPASSVQRGP